MNLPIFYDVTLRDGSHANNHSFTSQFCSQYIEQAYKSGLKFIELGHGNGLGGSSLQIGKSKDPYILRSLEKYINSNKDIKFGMHVIPGLAKFADIKKIVNQGISIIRVASHCSEADTTETYIEYAANCGCEVWGLLMMSHMIKPDHLAKEAEKMQSYGASRIVFLDSAGSLTPSMVEKICIEILSVIKIPLGIHTHNNLNAALANSLSALSNGCSSIDVCSRGYGAGAGNLSLESIIAILEKDGVDTGISFDEVIKLANLIQSYFPQSLPQVDSLSVSTGFYGLFSGYKKKIIEVAKEYNIEEIQLVKKLGEIDIIAGQEDQIISTASELSNKEQKS